MPISRADEKVPVADIEDLPEQIDSGELLTKIVTSMEQSRFYARHGTTLGDFADELGMPAYKLRASINTGLGYRNFNQFLNHYRIVEASERLVSEPELPVLSIALDVGFKSLSSFNKMFKAQQNQTPTEFRGTRPG